MSDQLNTGQQTVAPVIDGQAPATDAGVVAPVINGQADAATVVPTPPENQIETPSTPPVGQAEVKVDESGVAGTGNAGNQYGTIEEQNKSLRQELEKRASDAKTQEQKYQDLEKDAQASAKWIDDYSPTLEYVLGDKANPELKKQILDGMQNRTMTPQDVQAMMTKTLEGHEAKKTEAANVETVKKSQDAAYNGFMEANPEIKNNPVLHQKLLNVMQTDGLPLTSRGYEAAKYFMGSTNQQPNNSAQEQAVNNAILAGGQQAAGGTPEAHHHFDVKRTLL